MDKRYKIVPMLEVRKLQYAFDRWDGKSARRRSSSQ